MREWPPSGGVLTGDGLAGGANGESGGNAAPQKASKSLTRLPLTRCGMMGAPLGRAGQRARFTQMTGSRIKCVYFRTPMKFGAGTLALVEYADGQVMVLLDDRPVDGCVWTVADLEHAVAGFMQVQRQLERERAPSAGG